MNWQEFDGEINKLANKISTRPEVIVAIVRGGLVPARLLAARLDIKDMYCLTVRKDGAERSVITAINDDLSGKPVLVVEDVLESGASLQAAKAYLKSLDAVVETAALYTLPGTPVTPTYSVGVKATVPTFPWE